MIQIDGNVLLISRPMLLIKRYLFWGIFFIQNWHNLQPTNVCRSLDWDNPDGIKCALETTPILNQSMYLNVGTDRRLFVISNNITENMKVPVHFIDITSLSEYRKDAHTSVYTIRQGKMLTPEQQADPATYADCIHWCLPGLPDTWNEFIYTRIIARSWHVRHNSHYPFLFGSITSVNCFSCKLL